ncbi:hypothetical protein Htur_3554 [Haloterrigena turkmenica DSM 5511]|uniref:Uncharacterized protein n=1 Tax=Haloterrigena turkmenica (strain ATCC 51198 / DSM 5511 / JCM 9101 / NCIMB 13204 / VKM B-1734 / 4k) TaxID=543526 RepID=D2RR20_HALTV|nr:hypothetical protein [Haloterrigena turkmenica]ADB62416.1 hypothetical protein Htur_3554 [Haloterrigena turkmenica DSM 5511]
MSTPLPGLVERSPASTCEAVIERLGAENGDRLQYGVERYVFEAVRNAQQSIAARAVVDRFERSPLVGVPPATTGTA